MPDFDAITTALAARFAPGVVTPPTGLTNIRQSTGDLPNTVTVTPLVLVFPEAGTFLTGNGTRTGDHQFFVQFFFQQTEDLRRDTVAIRKWLTVLVDQCKASTQLGGAVVFARVDAWKTVLLTYAGDTFSGVELTVTIRTSEAWAATA